RLRVLRELASARLEARPACAARAAVVLARRARLAVELVGEPARSLQETLEAARSPGAGLVRALELAHDPGRLDRHFPQGEERARRAPGSLQEGRRLEPGRVDLAPGVGAESG